MKKIIAVLIIGLSSLANAEFVARVYYNQVADYDKLHAYDILEFNNKKEKYFLALVNDAGFEQLKKEGWKVARDIQKSAALSASILNFSDGYRTVDELYQDLSAVTSAYPNITELVDYGDAYCKSLIGPYFTPGGDTQKFYNLLALKITNKKIITDKPVFFLMAGIHAREITTPEVAMRFIDFLTQNYETNADVRRLVDYQETWVVPSVNPEGHWIVELGATDKYGNSPFYQRKNANHDDGATDWPPNGWYQYGVDLNRNHSYNWGGAGASTNPVEQTFRGRAAASEPEICNLQNLITNLIPDQREEGQAAPTNTTGILISLHSYSELVLWPWAYTSAAAPNKTELKMMGDKFASFNNYTSKQSSGLYPTTGDSTDWAYGALGIPAFTFELGKSFMPSYSEVDNDQWPANKPAFIYAAKIARAPYQLVHGPDVSDISFTSGTGDTVVVSAKIDDSNNGGQFISSAQLFIDAPYWQSNSVAIPMRPADGAFDSSNEIVFAEISVTNFMDKTKIIYVRGTDADNNSGPVSAIFSKQVPEPLCFLFFFSLFFHPLFLRICLPLSTCEM